MRTCAASLSEANWTLSPTAGKSKGETFEDCREVEAIPGENEVSVAAFNSSNTVQSYMKTVSFNSKLKPEEPHLYILAIGIDQYKDTNVNLKYAVKDARDIEEKIKVQAATLYNPRNIHYELLTDRESTKANITSKINELTRKIRSLKTVLSSLSQATECFCRISTICSPMTITAT